MYYSNFNTTVNFLGIGFDNEFWEEFCYRLRKIRIPGELFTTIKGTLDSLEWFVLVEVFLAN